METLLDQASSLIPLLATSVGVFVFLFVANWLLLARYPEFGNERKLPRQLAMLGFTIAGALAIALTLPVGESTRNQVIGLLGVLLSGIVAFSSTTVISNLMAGLMLHVAKPFRTGDFIRIGEHFGRVSERGLFDTEIQTEQRELVYLSNIHVVTHPVTVVRSSGTIIATDLSLGYDTHHSRVEALLLSAAKLAGLEEPWVQITQLGDYSITYRVCGLLTDVKGMLSARSRLNRAVLDTLHGDGIEIVSPAFMNQRQMTGEARILPTPEDAAAIAGPLVPPAPEEIVFDKAEQAEQQEKLKVELQEAITTLEAEAKSAEGEAKDKIFVLIEQKRAQLVEIGRLEAEKERGDSEAAAPKSA
jgi:small-conductance mechanosensitive channel